jgi:hypothetical protein
LSSVLSFASDASDSGMGAVYQSHWWSAPFNSAHWKHHIAWRELLAIVVSCRLWGHEFRSKRVLIECDNLAIVYSVNNGTSKNHDIMSLIRDLFFVGSFFSFDVRLKHVAGVLNVGPDLLSRLKIAKFHNKFPDAELAPTTVPESYLM